MEVAITNSLIQEWFVVVLRELFGELFRDWFRDRRESMATRVLVWFDIRQMTGS